MATNPKLKISLFADDETGKGFAEA